MRQSVSINPCTYVPQCTMVHEEVFLKAKDATIHNKKCTPGSLPTKRTHCGSRLTVRNPSYRGLSGGGGLPACLPAGQPQF